MLEKIVQENYDILLNVEIIPPKHNQLWGSDYILMDSQNFMGGQDGEKYEKIISMFMNIWNATQLPVV